MPTVPVRVPGFVTVTVFWPVPPLMFQAKLAVPVAPVPSFTVTVTVLLAAAVGVPEISPVEALIASPAGRPVAE